VTENCTIVERYCQDFRQAGCYCGDGRYLRVAIDRNVAWFDSDRADPVKYFMSASKQLILVEGERSCLAGPILPEYRDDPVRGFKGRGRVSQSLEKPVYGCIAAYSKRNCEE
jgi:hypothetical protein